MSSTSPSTPSRRPLRRRTMTAAGLAIFLGGSVFGMSVNASADDGDKSTAAAEVGPGAISAEARIEAFQRAGQRANAQDLEFLANEFSELVAFVSPEGISLDRRALWGRLADCESGEWGRGGVPIDGTRTWDYDGGYFEGGLQFDPRTWDGFRDADMPGHAGDATPLQQMVVAERVLERQGWKAWPVCSRKLGLR